MANHIETARNVRNQFQRTVEAIRNDPTLSDAGKRQKLTAAYQDAAAKLEAAKRAHASESAKTRESLQKSVFGLSFKLSATDQEKTAAQLAYRDAMDRTANLRTEADAMRMLEDAYLTGDATLTRAVSLAAYKAGWSKALNRYSEIAPDHARRIRELQDADRAAADPMQRLADSMAFSLDRPREVDANALYQSQPAD